MLHYKEQIREENNYEIVLLTESEEKIEQMLADKRIKDAYLGSCYYVFQNEDKLYPNALYVNTINPYKIYNH